MKPMHTDISEVIGTNYVKGTNYVIDDKQMQTGWRKTFGFQYTDAFSNYYTPAIFRI